MRAWTRVAPARIAPLVAACALGALAAGCNSQPTTTTGSIEVSDYRVRHPIVLTDGTRSLDVFPTWGSAISIPARPPMSTPSCWNTAATGAESC